MERNKGRSLALSRRRILTKEEWSRVNEHLYSLEKLKINNLETVKNQILLIDKTSKCDGTLEEETEKKKEIFPGMKEGPRRSASSDRTKEEIIKKAKKILFENKDYARRLFHGLRLSSVLHERNKQIDFNRKWRKSVEMIEREMKLKLREEVKNHEEEMQKEKLKKIERNEIIKKSLEKQISHRIEERQREELEKVRERKNIMEMNEELKWIAEKERKDEKMKKENLKKDIENYTKSEMEIRSKLRKKEKEQEEVNKIYQEVAWKINIKRKDKEKARFSNCLKVDKDIFKDSNETSEFRSDADRKLKSFLLLREARKKALLNDLLTDKKKLEEEMERRRKEEELEKRKSNVERCRKEEMDRVRDLKERQQRQKLLSNMKKYYNMQIMEKKKVEEEENKMDKKYVPDFSRENKIITDYCDELVKLVNRRRRPLFPVAAAAKEVKKEFGIETVKNFNFLKSNIPTGQ